MQHNIDKVLENIRNNINLLNINDIIKKIPENNEITLLGESTHGTSEFYDIRSSITKSLIENREYTILLIEAEWPDIYRVNTYIQGKGSDKNASESLGNIDKFPKWMWRNNMIVELIEWLRAYNAKSKKPIYIFGIDCQQIYKSYYLLLEFLKKTDMAYYMYIVRLISFFKQFKNESDYSNAIIDGRLKKHIDTIPEILQDLLSNYQWEKVEDYLKNSKDYNLDPIDIISSEQNIEILANAEEYFRKMVLEPPGSQASWNTRDQHMLMTIMRIRNRFQQISGNRYPPKIIVWAHNSHIGNSDATNRGGKDFTQNNTWNLGQMVSETFPNHYIIGFYTSIGTVTANSHNNDIVCKQYTLNSPCMHSYEWFFNKVSEKNNLNTFYIDLSGYKTNTIDKPSIESIFAQELNIEYTTLFGGNKITSNKEIDSEVIFTNIEEGFRFIAKSRIVDKQGIVRLELDKGGWITECIPNASTVLYCRPINKPYPENLTTFFNSNLMQRWIGITYCKDTEIQSHYGNSNLAKQYNMIVYVDKSTGISSID
tara:strand:- start:1027 stop:2646 length:1620 start_codon:yes stop_codon:yes gene_type:complete